MKAIQMQRTPSAALNHLQACLPAPAPCTAVLFDGSCPLCSREISMYRGLPASAAMQWVDVSSPDYCPPPGVTRAALMRRFHAVKPDGEVLSGALAFVHVWSQLPGWRHLATLARIPGVPGVMEVVYCGFLVVRPSMQSIYRRWLGQR
jgi:ubiquinone biosynthesis monooxygenase Coq7